MKPAMFGQYLRLAWSNLLHRKKRAWLTVIGIFIGIMAVVALVSLGQGLEQGVNEEFSKLGIDKVFITPRTAFGGPSGVSPNPLTESDVERIRDVRGVKEVATSSYRTARVEWEDELGFYYIVSMPSDPDEALLVRESFQINVEQGRQLQKGDRYKAVVGADYKRTEAFQDTLQLGSTILINNQTFTVVGFRERIGNSVDDRQIVIPAASYEEIIPESKDEYNFIMARVQPGLTAADVGKDIRRALQRERDVDPDEEDFNVETAEDIRESFENVLSLIQIVLTGVAAISLLVGAVGIMNTMYTAVLERTKEIGIMKAVGATNESILTIFLIESGLLGLGGGIVGVILGLATSFGASALATQALGNNILQAYVSWWLVLGGLAFAFIVGALAGFLPARQAANMKPVDSLRYE
jgi:putative ABC transport system permease protein